MAGNAGNMKNVEISHVTEGFYSGMRENIPDAWEAAKHELSKHAVIAAIIRLARLGRDGTEKKIMPYLKRQRY